MLKVLLEAKKFRVETRSFSGSDGRTHTHEVVAHPGAVLIVPILSEDRMVMIHNHRHSIDQELLEFPAGTLEPNEPPIECAARELIEETGYRAGRLEPLCEFYTSPGVMTEIMYCFIASDLRQEQQKLEAGERIRVEAMSIETAKNLLVQGTLRDGKTIAALATYLMRKG